jgi:hypothetical protein
MSAIKPKCRLLLLSSELLVVDKSALTNGLTDVLCIPPAMLILVCVKAMFKHKEKLNKNSSFLIK